MAASNPTKNGPEIEETSKNESMPIAKPEAKNDTVNATDKDASLKNVENEIREGAAKPIKVLAKLVQADTMDVLGKEEVNFNDDKDATELQNNRADADIKRQSQSVIGSDDSGNCPKKFNGYWCDTKYGRSYGCGYFIWHLCWRSCKNETGCDLNGRDGWCPFLGQCTKGQAYRHCDKVKEPCYWWGK